MNSVLARSLAPVLLATYGGCVTTQSESEEDERWSVTVLDGVHHIGSADVADWPPPLGECIDRSFSVPELPSADEVLLSFSHAGEPRGLIEVNGHVVFGRVDFADRIASALVDIVLDVSICAVTTALPGDPDCDPIEVQVDAISLTRRFPASTLTEGDGNTLHVCDTDGDFIIAEVRLLEAPPRAAGATDASTTDNGATDAGTTANGATDAGAD